MKSQVVRSLASATMLLSVTTAASAQPMFASPPVQSAGLPTAAAVSAFYSTRRTAPIWFRGGTAHSAAGQLVAILRRAPYDGLASGPQLATQVEAAIARASSGNPADAAIAEQTLSTAWVTYVQAIRRPTPGMYYAAPALRGGSNRADQILLTAAAAPSLASHLQAVANINPIYAQLRDAAWLQAQTAGGIAAPEPRLLTNLERARAIAGRGRFVVVDAGTQRMTMFDNGQAVDSMKIIVGMSKYPTPLIASYIHYVTMNPYWNAPDHLVREAIAPNALRQGAGYLKSRGYEVMADWTEQSAVVPFENVDWKAVAAGKLQIRVRQKPGPKNFMATMKIPFQNDQDIYLHDTPSKDLFAKSQRALSNGCVRLEDAPRFARWLLGHDAVAPSAEPEQHLKLAQGVPVYLTYLTVQPDNGKLTYLTDVYGWDKASSSQVATH
jgi:murein L,D-transpeptidase YcbB/YkuD